MKRSGLWKPVPAGCRLASTRGFGSHDQGVTFKVEYIFYFSVILVAVVLCIYKIASIGKVDQARKSRRTIAMKNSATGKTREKGSPDQLQQSEEVRQREALKVPTPWGWPGNATAHQTHFIHTAKHTSESRDEPATLHRWVDHLVSSKQTKNDQEYLRRRESSMRALLEDRFVSPKKMTKMEYEVIKRPLLRDPSEPHDQMDNFPNGRLEKIESGFQESSQGKAESSGKIETIVYEESPALKSPWGW